ncbi:hypothetical protein K491DRAFT_732873 [Lophiostoma macrostomum CBS 122681]|uniref:Uncharacterized protein n=1 Tax=Lophiostoma macrostomum CBS 122681 TaxID=1314788 RepID=A0A6A6STI8_9PLEO|nr:hypothetical protein K491DRAFT_732873 [Lophiostoma macrostomum CBS 122681]
MSSPSACVPEDPDLPDEWEKLQGIINLAYETAKLRYSSRDHLWPALEDLYERFLIGVEHRQGVPQRILNDLIAKEGFLIHTHNANDGVGGSEEFVLPTGMDLNDVDLEMLSEFLDHGVQDEEDGEEKQVAPITGTTQIVTASSTLPAMLPAMVPVTHGMRIDSGYHTDHKRNVPFAFPPGLASTLPGGAYTLASNMHHPMHGINLGRVAQKAEHSQGVREGFELMSGNVAPKFQLNVVPPTPAGSTPSSSSGQPVKSQKPQKPQKNRKPQKALHERTGAQGDLRRKRNMEVPPGLPTPSVVPSPGVPSLGAPTPGVPSLGVPTQGVPTQIAPPAGAAPSPTQAGTKKRRIASNRVGYAEEKWGKLENAPYADIGFPPGNITAVEILTFCPRWIGSWDVVERLIENEGSMSGFRNIINAHRDVATRGKIECHSVYRMMQSTARHRFNKTGDARWYDWRGPSGHNFLDERQWDKKTISVKNFRTQQQIDSGDASQNLSIAFKDLANDVARMPQGDDALDLTRMVQYHLDHPDEEWYLPEHYGQLLNHIGGPLPVTEQHMDPAVIDRYMSASAKAAVLRRREQHRKNKQMQAQGGLQQSVAGKVLTGKAKTLAGTRVEKRFWGTGGEEEDDEAEEEEGGDEEEAVEEGKLEDGEKQKDPDTAAHEAVDGDFYDESFDAFAAHHYPKSRIGRAATAQRKKLELSPTGGPMRKRLRTDVGPPTGSAAPANGSVTLTPAWPISAHQNAPAHFGAPSMGYLSPGLQAPVQAAFGGTPVHQTFRNGHIPQQSNHRGGMLLTMGPAPAPHDTSDVAENIRWARSPNAAGDWANTLEHMMQITAIRRRTNWMSAEKRALLDHT